ADEQKLFFQFHSRPAGASDSAARSLFLHLPYGRIAAAGNVVVAIRDHIVDSSSRERVVENNHAENQFRLKGSCVFTRRTGPMMRGELTLIRESGAFSRTIPGASAK